MADIFGRVDQVLLGGLSSDSLFMSWPELANVGGGLGLLIQQVGLDYRQNIRRIFEIGPGVIPSGFGGFVSGDACDTTNVFDNVALADICATRVQPTYYIISRPEGTLQMGRFIGPTLLTTCFYRTYGNACSPNVMTMSGRAGCSAADAQSRLMTWTLGGVTLNGIRMDVSGQEMVFQENLGAMFSNLDLDIEGDDGTCAALQGAA
jgi:hypothetical protein